MRVKIGMSSTPRELDLDLEDPDALAAAFEKALSEGDAVLWVTDEEGRRHCLVVDKIAYLDIEPARDTTIGFGG